MGQKQCPGQIQALAELPASVGVDPVDEPSVSQEVSQERKTGYTEMSWGAHLPSFQ